MNNNTIEYFKEIVEGNYGIIDLQSYNTYKMKVGQRGITKEEIEKLSPDNIDSRSFWEYIEKNPEISKDAIAYGMTKENTIEDVNKQNFCLACSLGIFNHILMYKDSGESLLDIGAGYGMLKEFVEKNTNLKYVGVDIYPKFTECFQVGEYGSTLPLNVMSNMFLLIISTNVFQHLSEKQRMHYYEQIEKILYPVYGIFTVSYSSKNKYCQGFICKDTQKEYNCHYGQYIELQTVKEIEDDLLKYFEIISVSQRVVDGSITFNCKKKTKSTSGVEYLQQFSVLK